MTARPSRSGRRVLAGASLAIALFAGLGGVALPGTANASGATTTVRATPPTPKPGTAWFGPDLDWQKDSARAYDRRLGADASLFAQSTSYPLTPTGLVLLDDLSRQSAQAKAIGVLTMQPPSLARLNEEDASKFAAAVARATQDDDSFLLLRFAPEMNGSWTPWGRRPVTYVRAFRTLADAVHDATDAAKLVWSPSYGAGYPFSAAINSTTTTGNAAPDIDQRNLPYLDTNGDDEVTGADDPYGPYYPGDRYVDWVGLTMLRYGSTPRFGANTLPLPGEVEARFMEQFGYGDDKRRDTFYVRFAGGRKQPFLLATGAMYNPRRGGTPEDDIKRAWLRQVVNAVADRPMLRAVTWLEQSRVEPEVGGIANWNLTAEATLAKRARILLDGGAITLGPIKGIGTDAVGDRDAADSTGIDDTGTDTDNPPEAASVIDDGGIPPLLGGALAALALALVAAVMVLRARRRRMVPPWLR